MLYLTELVLLLTKAIELNARSGNRYQSLLCSDVVNEFVSPLHGDATNNERDVGKPPRNCHG